MIHCLRANQVLLMVVDLQERLLPAIDLRERVLARSILLIRALKILGAPMIWTEQYRKGLGPTDPAIVEAIGDAAQPLEKTAFGCLDDPTIRLACESTGRAQLILCGIETHVCILQTALRALEAGLQVYIAEDAVGSRRPGDRETALRRLAQAGAVPATVEMLIMELLGVAQGERFKAVLPLLKQI